jgi:histidine ammonia-lyase
MQQVAHWMRKDLGPAYRESHHAGRSDVATWDAEPARLQDRYSLRCAPHVIGCVVDALPWLRQLIETELNSVNDNPVVDAEAERLWHGGHFYGGHMAMAMDTLKVQIANLADLLDRQMALLTDPRYNQGLPANLVGQTGERAALCHGFKGVHISCSAWTAEALKLTMPASVFSRSTECHNQDKVSMGTISARDCWRVLQLTEQVAAASLLAVMQAYRLRVREFAAKPLLAAHTQAMLDECQARFPCVIEDRALEADIRSCVQAIQAQAWMMPE